MIGKKFASAWLHNQWQATCRCLAAPCCLRSGLALLNSRGLFTIQLDPIAEHVLRSANHPLQLSRNLMQHHPCIVLKASC